ncbi:hypothetical protein LIER_43579 [Lithospermum erythrorhizon]|uniref:Uncharacterized protein n=1 Tax=Lithospermum erythrorhizon TaxID=34254 RepID=A0AAV3QGW6_LITER
MNNLEGSCCRTVFEDGVLKMSSSGRLLRLKSIFELRNCTHREGIETPRSRWGPDAPNQAILFGPVREPFETCSGGSSRPPVSMGSRWTRISTEFEAIRPIITTPPSADPVSPVPIPSVHVSPPATQSSMPSRMVTRSQTGYLKPKIIFSLATSTANYNSHHVPTSYSEAKQYAPWCQAMADEYTALA